jgi:inner membrane transporter RhtA
MPTGLFGIVLSVEPAVAATLGFAILGQDLGARDVVAIGLVVVASAGASLAAPPAAPEVPPAP